MTENGPAHFPVRTRILHWLNAILIFAALLVGFVMVNSLGSYAALVSVHMTLGAAILALVVVRIANRFTHRVRRCRGRSVGSSADWWSAPN